MAEAAADTLNEIFGRTGSGPLSGVVVADFSRVLAGPYCTMLLADMGATVIKVESPDGDDARTWKPPVRDEESTFFLSVNRNKHSITLDFNEPSDLALAQQLAARADIVVENFKPHGLERYGLDYAAIADLNPTVIYASITGFGTGAGAALPGYDLLVQAASGMMSLTGGQETEPYRAGLAMFDVITGLHASTGILGALHHRTTTGEGQRVELNLLSSALSGMVNQSAAYVTGGVIPTRMGNEHPSLYPYEPMLTGDGRLVIAAANNGQFARLCAVLEVPELAQDQRFSSAEQRNAHRSELRILLEVQLAARSAEEWFPLLSGAGLPCAPIQDVKGGVDLADRLGLDPVVLPGENERQIPTVRHPVSFSRTPATYDLAPPMLGSSSDLVRGWLAQQLTAAR
ncbi:CaiB/BaiF CoA-transferase family protein [Arthrobacter sp. CAN_C5]|uniref:CaiB/BaiF CoA transferase family protein n=1 Tax=Arthrobacter sp. CAN_C5 TaxID=2760706 RepID=UPI001AE59DAD|nr:CoA transferase [Arthrobacter sp. CAN_C5]MBP2217546.1 crotonobetainyl-CoA:carnitine CoA-transferase CaiB-like acyl-CoA transferase [Arthrobacter sp. CAN_C5]